MNAIKYLVLLAAITPFHAIAQSQCSAQSAASITPLYELYTSEGCSSCPPADRWLSRTVQSIDSQQANYLAFHVDYWDDIGWPDRFAQAKYSDRQRQRVGVAGGSTVYTPQVMQGRDVNLHWYEKRKVDAVLDQNKNKSALINIQISAQQQQQQLRTQLSITNKSKQSAPASVYLALYEDGLSTQVRAGENRGETLKHDRVVRGLFGPWPLQNGSLQKTVDVKVPANVNIAKSGLVAFVHSVPYNDTLQSVKLELNRCSASQPNKS